MSEQLRKKNSLFNKFLFSIKEMVSGFLSGPEDFSKNYIVYWVKTQEEQNPNFFNELHTLANDDTENFGEYLANNGMSFPDKEHDMFAGKKFVPNLTNEQAKKFIMFFDEEYKEP